MAVYALNGLEDNRLRSPPQTLFEEVWLPCIRGLGENARQRKRKGEIQLELRFDESEIIAYASRYGCHFGEDYDTPVEALVPEVKEKGYLTKSDLITVSKWIRNRRTDLVRGIDDKCVQETTHAAFNAISDHERIKCLRRMAGVGPALGSSILHWFRLDDYPIWSSLSLKAIRSDDPHYQKWNPSRWEAYISLCQNTARQNGVDMRRLDRAFCVYTRENQ